MHVLSQVRKFLMVGARVEFTLVSGTYSCLTFIVSVAVHVEAACGIHVAMLTSIFCTGLPQYCKPILKHVGVAWWPRARGQTDQGPV
jgi:predicted nucleic acid-binding Zn finger protein